MPAVNVSPEEDIKLMEMTARTILREAEKCSKVVAQIVYEAVRRGGRNEMKKYFLLKFKWRGSELQGERVNVFFSIKNNSELNSFQLDDSPVLASTG